MAEQQIPPWLQERIMNLQRSQKSLQMVAAQKSNIEVEQREANSALEQLRKAADDDTVYRQTGSVLVRRSRKDVMEELEEQLTLAKTRTSILVKQEARLKQTISEQEAQITSAMRGAKPG